MRARNIGKLLSEKTCLTWKLRYTTYNLVVVLQVLGKGGRDSADLARNHRKAERLAEAEAERALDEQIKKPAYPWVKEHK